jgi:formyltetrahydrofolate deformylase
MPSVIILIKSPDQKGLVARVSSFCYEADYNILDCQQHVDTETGEFFMRLKLDLSGSDLPPKQLEREFAPLAGHLDLTWSIHYSDKIARVAILVSRTSHCLYDLLVRAQEGELACEIPLIVGNHAKLESVAEQFSVPFFHLPVTPETKTDQEVKIRKLLDDNQVDVIILARYMQILTPEFVSEYRNRIINIHHAFLPAFQGANPYRRAYQRGVKMIGATAHYATSDLDEGPIIEQDVERVTHEDPPRALRQIGRDIERVVLARAVKAHLEHRIIVAGRRTIVFSAGA